MKYRKIEKLGIEPSLYGLGCMRLPVLMGEDGKPDFSKIDEPEAIKMIRYAIDNGTTYIDTAFPYHGENSESLVGKALSDGYREKVILASKLPVWKIEKYEDFEEVLDLQLKKLNTSYLDFYLLHALDKDRWEKMNQLGVMDFMLDMKKKGKIKFIAFSFHDKLEVFKNIVDAFPWDMCQIQLNILDENYQAGLEGLKYASAKGISVVIMEPLKGGQLAKIIPDSVKEIYDSYDKKYSPVEWAFKWLGNFKEVMTILSGASDMDQLKSSLEIFDNLEPDSLTSEDLEIIEKVKLKYFEKIKVGCTGCNYCMPCPSGVDIPGMFYVYNNSEMLDYNTFFNQYKELINANKDSSHCVECGKCEGECPQSIKIIEKLKEAKNHFEKTR